MGIKKKSRKMKSTFTILIAVLAIVSVSSKVLFPGDFSAKNDQLLVTDETTVPTDAPTTVSTDAPTDAPTDTPTDAPTDVSTDTPTDGTTEDGTTVPDGTTEDGTTEDGTTIAPTEAPITTGAASI